MLPWHSNFNICLSGWFYFEDFLYYIIVKCCNLKEMKCTKSVCLFFWVDDMITQEKIQKLLSYFIFMGGGGGG